MIDFSPLRKTLEEKDMVISDMRDDVLHPKTIAQINRNGDVNLSTIEKICVHLNVPIEKVVRIVPDDK
ncbi:helix-turn-helix domain-containing protein [Peribacillus huizhouensis]|uniref:DNA (Cytosine-5)-methyltransferase 1 n=1 Tax=Peribacillus huizhouensis TaxID=1501239 RepID=A0ABR6CRB3_9BACI|nr:helix-turn-helix transcriptional regulator [Peribacillus huizhouensis]MBA9027572.1 DNA (cytosine-5)-methyltransferase 1 [Peribacillus huizhouensis]